MRRLLAIVLLFASGILCAPRNGESADLPHRVSSREPRATSADDSVQLKRQDFPVKDDVAYLRDLRSAKDDDESIGISSKETEKRITMKSAKVDEKDKAGSEQADLMKDLKVIPPDDDGDDDENSGIVHGTANSKDKSATVSDNTKDPPKESNATTPPVPSAKEENDSNAKVAPVLPVKVTAKKNATSGSPSNSNTPEEMIHQNASSINSNTSGTPEKNAESVNLNISVTSKNNATAINESTSGTPEKNAESVNLNISAISENNATAINESTSGTPEKNAESVNLNISAISENNATAINESTSGTPKKNASDATKDNASVASPNATEVLEKNDTTTVSLNTSKEDIPGGETNDTKKTPAEATNKNGTVNINSELGDTYNTTIELKDDGSMPVANIPLTSETSSSVSSTTNTSQTDLSSTTAKSEPSIATATTDKRTDNPSVPAKIKNDNSTSSDAISLKIQVQEDNKSMPSSIIALVTAITFAIVVVIGYVGLISWRRYLEHRYGHRELLVNEFDNNDLRHFEL